MDRSGLAVNSDKDEREFQLRKDAGSTKSLLIAAVIILGLCAAMAGSLFLASRLGIIPDDGEESGRHEVTTVKTPEDTLSDITTEIAAVTTVPDSSYPENTVLIPEDTTATETNLPETSEIPEDRALRVRITPMENVYDYYDPTVESCYTYNGATGTYSILHSCTVEVSGKGTGLHFNVNVPEKANVIFVLDRVDLVNEGPFITEDIATSFGGATVKLPNNTESHLTSDTVLFSCKHSLEFYPDDQTSGMRRISLTSGGTAVQALGLRVSGISMYIDAAEDGISTVNGMKFEEGSLSVKAGGTGIAVASSLGGVSFDGYSLTVIAEKGRGIVSGKNVTLNCEGEFSIHSAGACIETRGRIRLTGGRTECELTSENGDCLVTQFHPEGVSGRILLEGRDMSCRISAPNGTVFATDDLTSLQCKRVTVSSARLFAGGKTLSASDTGLYVEAETGFDLSSGAFIGGYVDYPEGGYNLFRLGRLGKTGGQVVTQISCVSVFIIEEEDDNIYRLHNPGGTTVFVGHVRVVTDGSDTLIFDPSSGSTASGILSEILLPAGYYALIDKDDLMHTMIWFKLDREYRGIVVSGSDILPGHTYLFEGFRSDDQIGEGPPVMTMEKSVK